MKIGILTFHRASNYGTALQAQATVLALQELGYEAELIDYRPEYNERTLRTRKLRNSESLKTVLSILWNQLVYGRQIEKRIQNFEEYISSMKMSQAIGYTIWDVRKIATNYDVLLSGSDQLWNERITGNDMMYFFPFDHPCKISYASSFGVSKVSEARKKEIAPLLEKFKYLSVREKTAQNMLRDILPTGENKISCVIDPTLLLDKQTWLKQANARLVLPSNGYILTYYMIETPVLRAVTKKLKQETGLPVVNVKPSKRQVIFHDGTNMLWAGPREFLGCYAGAKYVVTNSFHGTAFAINFEVPMYISPLPDSMAGEVNSRLVDILDRYGLSSRWVETMEDVKYIEWTFDILKLQEKKKEQKNESLCYIKKALENI